MIKKYSLIIVFILLFLIGCINAHNYSYKIDDYDEDKLGYISALPIIFDGVTPSSECISKLEKNIDEELRGMWKEQYIPMSVGRQEYQPLIDALATHLAANSPKKINVNLESILKTQNEFCTNLTDTSRCRYVILPRAIIKNATSQMILGFIYAIPLGPVIIYGTIPVPLDPEDEDIPVYTLTLLDLEKKSIVAEEVIALKKDIADTCSKYPYDYLSSFH